MVCTGRAYDQVDVSSAKFWSSPMRERDRAYAVLRRERPVSWQRPIESGAQHSDGEGYWAVVTQALASEVHRRPADFSSARGVTFDDLPPEASKHISFLTMDAPRHTKLKKLVSTGFTPRAVAELESKVVARARMIVDDLMIKGPGDFVDAARRLPLWAISEMVGVPEEQRESLAELVDDQGHMNDPSFAVKYPGVDPYEFTVRCLQRLADTGRGLAAERRRRPQPDLMTALVQASVDGERLTDDEIGDFFNLLIMAGYETTVHTMCVGLHALSLFPDQRALLCSDLDRYLPGAVEEMLRWATTLPNLRRTATRRTALGNQVIEAGDKVVVFLLSANRDEAVFSDPWRFDIQRNPNPHIAFGGGSHYCLGSPLARLELRVMFHELLSRLPGIDVTDAEYMVSTHLNGMNKLTVTF
ncbi:cytochrome P450 [Mycobacterium branderi]|uniref:Cytochrome P450 n=1 Tax=Mycobacterium branderi TaxID=43348 RepID=A0A7I7WIH3_9MYCO|nr:cytochrome P450 [Mycobacterium branderi]MCV7231711.1 cytochrome P450 [Mycobacterium branderi]ORA40318.1 hypothetical protein BST20_07150 [Mycobacterium branderi]BBZ15638.1 cytochrome P450 [Mycobacterium branderi]